VADDGDHPRTIAGHGAAWTRIVLDVSYEADGALHLYAADPIGLFALSDAEKSIDAGALLRERVIADPPYWALVWTGARAIAAVIASEALPLRGRVLDLGCGLGLAGLAAARRGAAVTFGDYLDEPLAFVRATLERGTVSVCDVRRIDFTSDDEHGRFDLILAADIVYDPAHYAPLASFLDRSLSREGTILLTESLRADASVFLEGLLAQGFVDEKRALWVMEDGRRERTWLHALTRTERTR
jgi:predicted nicotinamide N-methyase